MLLRSWSRGKKEIITLNHLEAMTTFESSGSSAERKKIISNACYSPALSTHQPDKLHPQLQFQRSNTGLYLTGGESQMRIPRTQSAYITTLEAEEYSMS